MQINKNLAIPWSHIISSIKMTAEYYTSKGTFQWQQKP